MRFLVRFVVFLLAILAAPAFAQVIDTPIAGRPPIPSITDPENLWYLDLSTGGRVIIWLRPDAAPKTVERIKILTRQHFYDGLPFHRVIEGFMAQGGDPKGDGTGGSTLPDLKAEFNWLPHVRGAVSAARAEKEDSANSQFFIVFDPKLSLDKKYTVFGRVIDGMQYVDAITRGEPPANPSRIVHAYIAADHPPAYVPAPPPAPAATLSPSSLGGAFLTPSTPAGKPAAPKTPNAKTLRAPAVVKPKAKAQ
ncbi:peptidylprolyl isomerase [Sphingomonas panacis]|uniref:peptidylprolyl isomerase n=1 Tax=Sphingomonas panacis TaxID=1560345 RepID=UPI0009F47161|nr:peptidylprolyl isomerase [Sphingomonas panacis]